MADEPALARLQASSGAVAALVTNGEGYVGVTCDVVTLIPKTEIKEEADFSVDEIWNLENGARFLDDLVNLQDSEADVKIDKGLHVKLEEDIEGSSTLLPDEERLQENELQLPESDEAFVRMLHDQRNTCPVCERKFRPPSRLRRHMAIHSDERKHKCSECGAGFKTLSTMRTHELTHRAVKPFKCSLCSSTQCTRSALQKHFNKKHSNTDRRVTCDICDMRFQSRSSLKNHVLRHSGKTVLCTACGRMFYSEKDLRTHVARAHELTSREAPELYECLHCDRVYTCKPTLANHMLSVHLRVKEYECPVCDRAFAVKAHFQKHMACHSGEKFSCNCGRSFSTKTSLDRHSLTHVNYRPYTCAMCGLTFTQKSSVERHIVTNMEKEHYKRFGTCKPITGGRGGYYTGQEDSW
ncbi:zinc finger protein 771-like [Bacillus rossius redtenbacheri]|uniref:zinc finger protein 771-like n=1 Tax=Bacillus rossius redtenbacheri TaxID=93214 RepID=UPI002FDD2E59